MNFDKFKHEWYQTPSVVTICLLIKNVDSSLLKIIFNETSVELSYNSESEKFSHTFELFGEINPENSSYKIYSTKVEIKLPKKDPINWINLEKVVEIKPKINKNWDQIMNGLSNELEDDNDPLNSLFQKIYKDGNDETRKAMIKSFTESHGTVLSTNWSEVKEKQVETKPPDGMEYKKYDI